MNTVFPLVSASQLSGVSSTALANATMLNATTIFAMISIPLALNDVHWMIG